MRNASLYLANATDPAQGAGSGYHSCRVVWHGSCLERTALLRFATMPPCPCPADHLQRGAIGLYGMQQMLDYFSSSGIVG